MMFASRWDAGQRLGRHLLDQGVQADVVVGLPRGGVVVAAEISRLLQRPLRVIVVRKIGHPRQRELAVGALAENGVLVFDEGMIGSGALPREDLDEIIREESERLWQYQLKFQRGAKPDFTGKIVLIVDDGLATGASAEAAATSARNQGASEIVIAVPVASENAVERLERKADKVIALVVDPDFNSVGRYYKFFLPTADEEVLELLKGGETSGNH